MSYTGGGFDSRVRNLLLPFPEPPSHMLLWLDSSDLRGTNGSPIDEWRDRSGYGNHATAAGAQRPTLSVASGINGLPAVVFDNSQTQFFNLPAGFSDFAAGLTLYVVHSPINTLGVPKALVGLSNAAVNSTYSFVINTSNGATGLITLQPGLEISAAAGVQTYAPCIFECRLPAGAAGSAIAADVYFNNVLIASGPSQVPLNTVRTLNFIGSDAIGSVFMYGGEMAEVILYPFALTAAQRAAVYAYFAYKYAL